MVTNHKLFSVNYRFTSLLNSFTCWVISFWLACMLASYFFFNTCRMAEFWLVDTASWLVELLTNWLVTLHTFLFFSAKQKINCWLASLLIWWLLIGWIVDFTFVYFCSNNYCKYISLSLYIKMDLLWKLYFLWFYNLLYDFIHYFFFFHLFIFQ